MRNRRAWRHSSAGPLIAMKLVVFGLSVSSSWGNGHATLWRGLCKALARRGHQVIFFERDVPYYAEHRDLWELPGGELALYSSWEEILARARCELNDCDVGMVTSYCPDGVAATDLTLHSRTPLKVFYDLDTPVTLHRLAAGETVDYLGPNGLRGFDLALSYTGGKALEGLKQWLGASRVAPLYGSVDPEVHFPVAPVDVYRCDFSYLGTYADDRQAALDRLFLEPARRMPGRAFLIGGALYPPDFPWTPNIRFVRHVPPPDHPAFYSSSRLTLNVTRGAMQAMGYCPSGRLFEAAACGVPIVSDNWDGLDSFFTPAHEILIASTSEEALKALDLSDSELQAVSRAARDRVLSDHTADRRVLDLEKALSTASGASSPSIFRGEPVLAGGGQ